MPNKEKIKNPSKNPQPKSRYKVTNWTDYKKRLKNRGKLSLYFPAGDFKLQLINENPYTPGGSGARLFAGVGIFVCKNFNLKRRL